MSPHDPFCCTGCLRTLTGMPSCPAATFNSLCFDQHCACSFFPCKGCLHAPAGMPSWPSATSNGLYAIKCPHKYTSLFPCTGCLRAPTGMPSWHCATSGSCSCTKVKASRVTRGPDKLFKAVATILPSRTLCQCQDSKSRLKIANERKAQRVRKYHAFHIRPRAKRRM